MAGFVANEEARHVADITEKLVNFVIETDTEIDVGNGPTDAGQLCYIQVFVSLLFLSHTDDSAICE